ncbi:hypothetical protein EDD29_6417 [Actinocorallia herbida]|uniref:Uncharacterized protein n=1 Tax=Actinocorallia herbida TaxID=58109 RepID=A0A3N1D6J5_9ACTN|nr:hypothetical protein [Actinocorallia herbida]ROO88738.1 hypothetical protein EDD29_6417 [Actinocorallia herbida]
MSGIRKAECLCVVRTAGREYPVERDAVGAGRVGDGLVRDVADVLAAHGWPVIEGESPDWYALMWVLVRFTMGAPVGRVRDGLR